ncbi:hypothetical protein ACSQ67_018413 [Phaseolus vulgaris]
MSKVEGGKRSGKEEKNLLLKGVESIDKALCIEKTSSTNSKSSKSLLLDPKSKAKNSKEDNLRKDKKFERIRIGKELLEAKRIEEDNERKRLLALRKAEKEEEKRAREKMKQKLEEEGFNIS